MNLVTNTETVPTLKTPVMFWQLSKVPLWFAVIGSLISILVLVGYLYGAQSFYLIVSFNPMAIHTAVSFLLLAVGLLLSRPKRGIIKEMFSADAGGEICTSFISYQY